MKQQQNTTGIEVQQPTEQCEDKKCAFHGLTRLHGRSFVAKVIKDVFHKTASLEFTREVDLPKYERKETRKTRIKAHVSPCLPVIKGDVVRIVEARPLAKTKNFVVVEVVKQ